MHPRDLELELDLAAVATRDTLFDLLAREAFPGWWGRNWDAFWDCISSDLSMMPAVLRIRGFSHLATRLPRDAALLKGCLDGIGCRVEWEP
jgi:RNAse (barnase) inhibitor barstar